jgi:hypothetical protein
MDTVTLVARRSAGCSGRATVSRRRGARCCAATMPAQLRASRPVTEDLAARAELADALAKDAYALLAAREGKELGLGVAQAAELLATVTGQDLDQTRPGVQDCPPGRPGPGHFHRWHGGHGGPGQHAGAGQARDQDRLHSTKAAG